VLKRSTHLLRKCNSLCPGSITAQNFEKVKYELYNGLIYMVINFMKVNSDITRALWVFHKYRTLHSS